MEIKSKLLNIQTELKAPKGQYNTFGKYNYRNCEDILEALKPLLKKENATIFINDEIVNIGDRYYIKATVSLMCCETGKVLTVQAYAREEESKKGMDGSQVTGASSSYARKYALNGLFAIDDTKDSDTTNADTKDNDEPKKLSTKEKVTKQTLETTVKLNGYGVDIPKLAKWYGVDLDKLTDEMKEKAIAQKKGEISMEELQMYRDKLDMLTQLNANDN